MSNCLISSFLLNPILYVHMTFSYFILCRALVLIMITKSIWIWILTNLWMTDVLELILIFHMFSEDKWWLKARLIFQSDTTHHVSNVPRWSGYTDHGDWNIHCHWTGAGRVEPTSLLPMSPDLQRTMFAGLLSYILCKLSEREKYGQQIVLSYLWVCLKFY